MSQVIETYCTALLNQQRCGFDEREVEAWVEDCLRGKRPGYRITDGLFDFYYRWASASFGVGLRLGLSLREDPSCPARPEPD